MDLFEYQARDLFAKHGVPVLAGEVIDTPEAAREATERLGGKSVVKAQVKVGGRGKAGGVKLAADPDEAVAKADGHPRHGHQGPHGPQGDARRDRAEIEEEYYVSFLLDRTNRTFLAMASVAGRRGDRGRRGGEPRRPRQGPGRRQRGRARPRRPREIVAAAKFPADVADQVAEVLQ